MPAKFEAKFVDSEIREFLEGLLHNFDKTEKKSRTIWKLLTAIAYKDVIRHFEQEKGPNGRWASWSDVYLEHMIKKGKANNNILQDKGTLRMGIAFPISKGDIRKGILLFNQVPYARTHDEGDKKRNIPARTFFWLSGSALEDMGNQVLSFLMKGKRGRR